MTRGGVLSWFAAGALVAALTAAPCLGGEPGYDVWFAGRVLSVDPQHERLVIARGPTETAARGIEECIVSRVDLTLLRPGMLIEAQADTRHRPWRILHLRVMERRIQRSPDAVPGLVFVPTPA